MDYSVNECVAKLKLFGFTDTSIAEHVGCSTGTIRNIRKGLTRRTSYEVTTRVREFLAAVLKENQESLQIIARASE